MVGIAGVSGNGQKLLSRALSGEDQRADAAKHPGDGGPERRAHGPASARALGPHFVPEERLGRARCPPWAWRTTLLLTRTGRVSGSGWIRWGLQNMQGTSSGASR